MGATIELHLITGIKTIYKEFKSKDASINWLINFKSDCLVIGYIDDGTFGVVYGT